ncbi:expressed unknown protein [Seminavis robusta]|uniref:Uncharacterized protein n=1 Tax=Seminavis robusta TaxID=568900 RepID=A0A9N8ECL2_9STRA|nr:expressed unknown protein [Seminavis robusta]|eukprot:Sro977_g227020.1 n/a (472) ;mRNA; f:14053-15846
MVLTVLMGVEGDIVVGGSRLLEGYDDGILHDMPNATFLRWCADGLCWIRFNCSFTCSVTEGDLIIQPSASSFCRLVTGLVQCLVGVVLVFDSFMLSMQSTTVIDLVLNLTALYFIQEVDEIAFALADMGILSSQIQADCEKDKNLKQVSPPEFIARCTLQFGDAFLPEMAYYSGQFHHQGFGWSDSENDRVTYIDDTGKLKLAYCNSATAWTISWVENGSSSCNYIFKSSNTDTFDVAEVAEVDNWVVKTNTTGDVPVDWLKLVCNDFTPELCNEAYGICKVDNSTGSKLNKCECKSKDRQGLNCDLPVTCRYFDLDARTSDGLAAQPGGYFLTQKEFVDLSFVPAFDYGITMMRHRNMYAPYMMDSTRMECPQWKQTSPHSCFFLEGGGLPEGSSEYLVNDEFISLLRDNDPANNPVATLTNISKTYPHFEPLFFSSPVNYFVPVWIQAPSEANWTPCMHSSAEVRPKGA